MFILFESLFIILDFMQLEQVKYEWLGERVDSFLSKELSLSRNFFQHIIKRWDVLVNSKKAKKSLQLQAGDIIEIKSFHRFLDDKAMEESPKIEIPILYEESDYLIINKPKWVLSHPRTIRDLHEKSVSGFLYHKYKSLPSIGNFIRAGIVHRLDKQTDWLMIIAKTEKALAHFKSLFQNKSNLADISEKEKVPLQKIYRAVAELSDNWKIFLDSIKTFPHIIQSLVFAKLPHTVAKEGITKVLDYKYLSQDRVEINLEILTWRTHQIRYHLSSMGLAIVWDYLYGKDTGEELQLSAYKLVFADLDWEIKTISI